MFHPKLCRGDKATADCGEQLTSTVVSKTFETQSLKRLQIEKVRSRAHAATSACEWHKLALCSLFQARTAQRMVEFCPIYTPQV